MDVTFRESEPYYPLRVTSTFGDSPDTGIMKREEDSSDGERLVHMGMMPCPVLREESAEEPEQSAEMSRRSAEEPGQSAEVPGQSAEEPRQSVEEPGQLAEEPGQSTEEPGRSVDEPENEEAEPEGGGTQTQGEMRVYARRRKQNEITLPVVTLVPARPLSQPNPTCATPSSDSEYSGDMIPLDSPPTPMSLRRTPRSNAGHPPDRYGFSHDIAQFVSYSSISPAHGAFIALLDSVTLPKCWQVAKENPKWKAAMLEELGPLIRTKHGNLCHYHLARRPLDKAVEQSPEGKVE